VRVPRPGPAPGADFDGVDHVVMHDGRLGGARDGRDHFARCGAPVARGHETDEAADDRAHSRHVENPANWTMGCHESTVVGVKVSGIGTSGAKGIDRVDR
jgi:hypothetical protein